MPVLVTSTFDDDSIKNERASMEKPFFHYKSIGIFRRSMAADRPKFEPVRDFMHVFVTCKYKKDRIKNNRKKFAVSISPL